MRNVTKVTLSMFTRTPNNPEIMEKLEFKDLNELQQWITEKNEYEIINNRLCHAVDHANNYTHLSQETKRIMFHILEVLQVIIVSKNPIAAIPENRLGVSVEKFSEVFRQEVHTSSNLVKAFCLETPSLYFDEAMEELQRLCIIDIRGDTIWMPCPALITTLVQSLKPFCGLYSSENK